MARIFIQEQDREITDVAAIREFLKPFGIWYEKWDVAGRVGPVATDAEILDAYAPEIDRLKQAGGYVTADVINVPRETKHWFNLCASKTIRCIRLFEDKAGWTPHYVEDSLHVDHPPICFGPQFLRGDAGGKLPSVVDV